MGDHGPPTPPLEEASLPSAFETRSKIPEEVNVLVTGFGPFKTFHINPSHLIASTLASPLINATNPKINLIVHPSPIRVSYPVVRALIPTLVTKPNIDFILHIGMAGGRNNYTVETRAHRDGYKLRDVDGNNMEDDKVWKKQFKAPEILYSDLDAGADVYKRWLYHLNQSPERNSSFTRQPCSDVVISDDAGRYLCDFIYYSSLVEFWKDDKEKKVLFLHVPGDTDDNAIEKGRRIAVALIRALVDSYYEVEYDDAVSTTITTGEKTPLPCLPLVAS